MDFPTAIRTCLTKYVDFTGRAVRSEFWWFFLAQILLQIVVSLVLPGELIANLISLALLLPNLAVGARRLHDTGRSGWWQLIAFIPLIGIIILIVWWATDSVGPNEYGQPGGTQQHGIGYY